MIIFAKTFGSAGISQVQENQFPAISNALPPELEESLTLVRPPWKTANKGSKATRTVPVHRVTLAAVVHQKQQQTGRDHMWARTVLHKRLNAANPLQPWLCSCMRSVLFFSVVIIFWFWSGLDYRNYVCLSVCLQTKLWPRSLGYSVWKWMNWPS